MSTPARIDDPTMELARQTGLNLNWHGLVLPASLMGGTLREANERRTRFLQEIDDPLINGQVTPVQAASAVDPYDLTPQIQEVTRALQRVLPASPVAQVSGRHMHDVPDLLTRIAIALRLWAGYMDAAKVIDAVGTRYELNNRNTRQRDIPTVEAKALGDGIYMAGVEAAPHYKWRVLGEAICREGIPAGSIVLRDWED
jgi:hypothetical protein